MDYEEGFETGAQDDAEDISEELAELEKDDENDAVVAREPGDDVAKGNHYVDKQKLYEAYKEWYAQCDIAKAEGKERPDPPRYISESILKICYKLASRYNFANYPFREEMVGDAIENIFRYIDRFDPEKSQNPFGYFSMTAYYAMVRRIKEEKKKAAIKYHLLINSGVLDTLQTQAHDDGDGYIHILSQLQMNANDSLANVLPPVKKRKIIKKESTSVDVEDMLSDGE